MTPLLVARWQVPSDQTTCEVDGATVTATAGDVSDSIARLSEPARIYEFAPRA